MSLSSKTSVSFIDAGKGTQNSRPLYNYQERLKRKREEPNDVKAAPPTKRAPPVFIDLTLDDTIPSVPSTNIAQPLEQAPAPQVMQEIKTEPQDMKVGIQASMQASDSEKSPVAIVKAKVSIPASENGAAADSTAEEHPQDAMQLDVQPNSGAADGTAAPNVSAPELETHSAISTPVQDQSVPKTQEKRKKWRVVRSVGAKTAVALTSAAAVTALYVVHQNGAIDLNNLVEHGTRIGSETIKPVFEYLVTQATPLAHTAHDWAQSAIHDYAVPAYDSLHKTLFDS